jgi:aspartokinase/homoserine dehydrogenase 1
MRAPLAEGGRMSLDVVAVARSREMLLADKGALTRLEDAVAAEDPVPLDLTTLVRHLIQQAEGGIPVLVDATASTTLPDAYAGWLDEGISIVTPNKQAGAGPLERWNAIDAAARRRGTLLRAEASVGAGLPVLSTLRSLRDTGDDILSIEGVLSGSLAFLLDAWSKGEPFSRGLREAAALGYLEPDPREDLSGRDVVRKMVILARGAGYALEASAVAVQGLVPASLAEGTVQDFWEQTAALDVGVEQILAAVGGEGGPKGGAKGGAKGGDGSVIRFVGSLSSDGHVTVGPQILPPTHPFAGLSGTGNAIAFRTRRYHETPLMIQGPGAGPEVTASGMFADLLEVVATTSR